MSWSLAKEGIRYLAVNYLSLILNASRGILLIGLLSPASLGLYRIIFTYASYFRYSNLGINALAFYRAPLKEMQGVYSTVIVRINAIMALAIGLVFTLLFEAIWPDRSSILTPDFYFFLFGILFFTQIGETFLTVAKITAQFKLINRYTAFLAVGSFILMVSFGYFWELRGVLAGLASATFLATLYVWLKVRSIMLNRIHLTLFRFMILAKNSLLIILPGMLLLLFGSIEVWLITFKYGLVETGYYSVVLAVVNILLVMNSDGAIFLYAKRSKDFKRNRNFVSKTTLISFGIQLFLCLISILPLTWGIREYFPSYDQASEIYLKCFWGIPFLVSRNIVMYYISNHKAIPISIVLSVMLGLKVAALLFVSGKSIFYTTLALSNVIFGISLFVVLRLRLWTAKDAR